MPCDVAQAIVQYCRYQLVQIMALNDGQAREKVKSFLQASGNAEAALGEVFTVRVDHANLATDVPVIYQPPYR